MRNMLSGDFMDWDYSFQYNLGSLDDYVNTHSKSYLHKVMIYGKPTEEEIHLLIRGIAFMMLKTKQLDVIATTEEGGMALSIDFIGEKEAVAFNGYQGTLLQLIFLESNEELDDTIKTLLCDGLDFLRYKYDYLGMFERVSDV